jgi:hypothetical protein
VISVQERASYMGRVRDLAKGACQAWIEKNKDQWAIDYPEWSDAGRRPRRSGKAVPQGTG